MILRGDRHVIVSESVNRGYWTSGHYPEAWTRVSVFKRYDPEPKGSGVEPHYHDGDEFWLFAEGEGEVWLGDRAHPITPNTAVYTPGRPSAPGPPGAGGRRRASRVRRADHRRR